MNGLIKERDVVLIGKDENGEETFDFPVTRLGSIEGMGDAAQVKENPEESDFLPIIDASDGEKTKKFSAGKILEPLNGHLENASIHISEEDRLKWDSKPDSEHTHAAATESGDGFMSAEDKKKLNKLKIPPTPISDTVRIKEGSISTTNYKIIHLTPPPYDGHLYVSASSSFYGGGSLSCRGYSGQAVADVSYQWKEEKKQTEWTLKIRDYSNLATSDDSFSASFNAEVYFADDLEYAIENPQRRALTTTASEIERLKMQLDNIDQQSIRALRAIAVGTDTDEDIKKLTALESYAEETRKEISVLSEESTKTSEESEV